MRTGAQSQISQGPALAVLRRAAGGDATAVGPEGAHRRCVPAARGVAAAASCTDASGNYVGVDPDVSLDGYIGVESLAGHILCPGARWRASHGPISADPGQVARLVYFGTSDENLYVESRDEVPAAEASLTGPRAEPGELAFFGSDVVAFLRRRRTPADQF